MQNYKNEENIRFALYLDGVQVELELFPGYIDFIVVPSWHVVIELRHKLLK